MDSSWHVEIYFAGFIAGISEQTLNTELDAANLCLLEKEDVYLIA
jgi:hypothetical protein